MADNIAIFRINYKSDFILTLNSDAGWETPFCIKFWTGAPSQAYFAGYDGTTYTHCAPVDGESTKLRVQFDDHHLPIGDLKFQIGYHFTVADFPNDTEDEVLNQASVIIEQDGEPAKVMLDFNGETAPEIEFSLPAYANEAQRIANEEQRIENEQARISAENERISNEDARIAEEQVRVSQEAARVSEFAQLKQESQVATADANAAAALANEKAALAQQKATYAQTQGDYAKAQGDTALADHQRAESDHATATEDHTQAAADHAQSVADHSRAESDHTRAESDHEAVEVYVDSLGAFDISAYHATGGMLAKYANLTAALGTDGANIPDTLRKGGMSVKFVQSSDNNKYVQYRLMSDSFNTTVSDWQGIDDEPTAGSKNLVTSGGVAIKTLKINRWATDNIGDSGVVIYRYDLKQIRIKTGTPVTSYTIVPFLDGAVYTYNNQLYIWDNNMLRPTYITPIYTEDPDINNCIEYMYSDNLPAGCYIYQFTRTNSSAVISIKDSNATTVARLSLDTPPIAGIMYEIPAWTTDGYHAYIVFNENTYSQSGINVPLLSQISAGDYAAIAQIDINKKKQIKENSRYYVKNTQFNPEVFIKGIEPGTADLGVIFSNSNVNNITNFQNWKYIPNDTGIVRTEWQGHQSVGITGTMSDLVSAWFVKAVNNADGDLVLAADEWSPTGGWHGYNGATQGTPTPTGRTLWCKVYADGKEVAVGNGTFANKVEIQWCNRAQACNTEKADGSGREVIEEIITVIFDEEMKAKVAVEAKALEDILVQHHYGLNTYNATGTGEINGDVVFVGDNTVYDKNETGVGGKGVTSEDKNCNEILFRGERFSFSLKIDEHSCGNFKYCTQPTGGSGIYGNPPSKGMLRTIDAIQNNPINFPAGSAIICKGVYDCYMSKFSI